MGVAASSSSAQRKLLRGIEHLATLRVETEGFLDDGAYVYRVEATESEGEVLYRCTAVERVAPPAHWALLAGEMVQNLRAALDHALWAVWKAAGGEGGGRHVQFPICTSAARFRDQRLCLNGIPEQVKSRVEKAQPYLRQPEAPSRQALELLRQRANIDKHRTLATVAVAVRNQFVGVGPEIEVIWLKYQHEHVLGAGETEVSRLAATSNRVFLPEEVQPAFSSQVRIEGLSIETYVNIAQRVFEAVTEIETGEPISPGANYPIYPNH